MKTSLLILITFLLAACSSNPTNSGPDGNPFTIDADPNPPDADPNAPDANPLFPDADPNGWSALITRPWTAAPGTEPYRCMRITVTEDIYITAFRSLAPLGTHHTVVSLNDPADTNPLPPDGEYNCSAGALTHAMLFATGVGTNDLFFPNGVAVKVEAGRQINLNIHLFNATGSELNGVTGTLVQTTTAAQVSDLAEMIFGGTAVFALAPNTNGQTASGDCRVDLDHTIVSVWPHMHQLGKHMKVEIVEQNNVIHDMPFNFNEQLNWPIAPVTITAQQTIRTTCTWDNTTTRWIGFADSSLDEMCLSGLYIYPPRGQGIFCAPGL